MDFIPSISDGISDAHSHWSGSTSQSQYPIIHPVISPTSQPNGRHPKNTKTTKWPAIRDFGEKECNISLCAKETFLVTAFSTGLFFYHQHSEHCWTMCHNIFTHTAEQRNCGKSFNLHYCYHCAYTIYSVDIKVAEKHVTVVCYTLSIPLFC